MTSLEDIRSMVSNPKYTYRQRVAGLANLAENLLDPPAVRKQCSDALANRIICDMYEGSAPYRPRYLLPDYKKVLLHGSEFLELPPTKDLDDALAFLLIMYSATPSITGYPVYFGDLGTLLLPYVEGVVEADLYAKLKRFWISLDRMFPDAFAHTNVSPDYAAVSCYNSLKIGGDSHTLVRINLKTTVDATEGGIEQFFNVSLPYYLDLTAELMESKILYLVEESHFFASSWLVHEDLLKLDKFSSMFGIFGLAEAVNTLMERDGKEGTYGHIPLADGLGYRITSFFSAWVAKRKMPYCEGNDGYAFLHSQSGIDLDIGVTAGTRIPIGTEPPLISHLKTVARHHHLFQSGISDVLSFDETAVKNPQAVVDVIRGAFKIGMRDFTFNLDSNNFIRITGYLVSKSDLEKMPSARHSSTYLGAGSVADSHVDQRIVKRVMSAESLPSTSS